MSGTPGSWDPPTTATEAPAPLPPPPAASRPAAPGSSTRAHPALRRAGVVALALASFGIGRATVQNDDDARAASSDDTVTALTTAEAAPAPAIAETVTTPSTIGATTTAVTSPTATTTTVVPATTAPPTGSAQSCPEFSRLVDDDTDAWGECVLDTDAAHSRAQAVVAFAGYTELTCNTDQTVGSTTCDATSPDGAVHRMTVLVDGSVESDVITQEAPFDRATCIEQPAAGALEKDPGSFTGRCLHMFGYITQFDSVTGSCGFRADVSDVRSDRWYEYDVNTIVQAAAPCPFLDPIVSGDIVEIWFESTGAMTYDTTVGGTATAVAGTLKDAVLVRHTP